MNPKSNERVGERIENSPSTGLVPAKLAHRNPTRSCNMIQILKTNSNIFFKLKNTSKELERIVAALTSRHNRPFNVHRFDCKGNAGISGGFRLADTIELPFAEKWFAIISYAWRDKPGRYEETGRAAEFAPANGRLISIVSSGESTMSYGSIRPEEEHHTATGRTNRFRKGVAASVAGIPVKWRIRQVQSIGRLIKDI